MMESNWLGFRNGYFIEQVFHGFVASSLMMVGAGSYGLFFLKPRRMIELAGKDI
jgi:hypothetical protein